MASTELQNSNMAGGALIQVLSPKQAVSALGDALRRGNLPEPFRACVLGCGCGRYYFPSHYCGHPAIEHLHKCGKTHTPVGHEELCVHPAPCYFLDWIQVKKRCYMQNCPHGLVASPTQDQG